MTNRESFSVTDMPDLVCTDDYELVGYFHSIGPCRSSGMGLTPADFGHVRDWRLETGADVSSWDRETLVMMSRAYVGERNKADGQEGTPPPWASTKTRENAGRTLGEILRAVIRERESR